MIIQRTWWGRKTAHFTTFDHPKSAAFFFVENVWEREYYLVGCYFLLLIELISRLVKSRDFWVFCW